MRHFIGVILIVATAFGASASTSRAANSVVVESKTVTAGELGVTIGVHVENDVEVRGINVPLEFRQVSPGSFTRNTIALAVQGRIAISPLINLSGTAYYPDPALTNHCSGPVSQSYDISAPPPVGFFTSPDAVGWVGANFLAGMPAGSDGAPGSGAPSLLLTFDVSVFNGTFEIDTCCVASGQHLAYLDAGMGPVPVSFTKGVVTISGGNPNQPPVAVCQDVTVSADGNCEAPVTPNQVDNGSSDPDGNPLTMSLDPSGPYPLGVTNVELVVDDGEFTDRCAATITVVDDTPPTAICPTNINVDVGFGETEAVVNFSINASDNCPGATAEAVPPSGSTFPLGPTVVTVTATDAALNTDVCTFTITVAQPPPTNSVVVESKNVVVGETGVTVGVYLSNAITVGSMILPLELREVTPGAFITNSVTMTVQGRVATSDLMMLDFFGEKGTPEVSNPCSGPVSRSYSLDNPIDFVSPDALYWGGVSFIEPCDGLAPGTDGPPGLGTPSFLLTFDVTSVTGAFEIDTCCIEPQNHLVYVDCLTQSMVQPQFTKGLITIGEMTTCNDDPGDVNCDGVISVLDVVEAVNMAFRNGPRLPPCCAPQP